jgi:hypothetical protein
MTTEQQVVTIHVDGLTIRKGDKDDKEYEM